MIFFKKAFLGVYDNFRVQGFFLISRDEIMNYNTQLTKRKITISFLVPFQCYGEANWTLKLVENMQCQGSSLPKEHVLFWEKYDQFEIYLIIKIQFLGMKYPARQPNNGSLKITSPIIFPKWWKENLSIFQKVSIEWLDLVTKIQYEL